jgi:hypothetical protein
MAKDNKQLLLFILLFLSFGPLTFLSEFHINHHLFIEETSMLNSSSFLFGSVTPKWSVQWGGEFSVFSNAITTDNNGYIYVMGYTEINPYLRMEDIYFIKFNEYGNEMWNLTWKFTGSQTPQDIEVDKFGNIYICGENHYPGTDLGPDLFLVKFNSDGDIDWNVTWDGDGPVSGLIIDKDSDLYIAAHSRNTIFSPIDTNITMIKFDFSGKMLWNLTVDKTYRDEVTNIAIDKFDKIYLGGSTVDGPLLMKLNKSGSEEWSKIWQGRDFEIEDIAIDNNENIFFIADPSGSIWTDPDLFIEKLNQKGSHLWNITLSGRNNKNFYPQKIALDKYGNVFLVGNINEPFTDDFDVFITSYTYDGKRRWITTWGDSGVQMVEDITLDDMGNIYVAGNTRDSLYDDYKAFILSYRDGIFLVDMNISIYLFIGIFLMIGLLIIVIGKKIEGKVKN